MWFKLTTSHPSKRSQSTIDRRSSPLHSWTSLHYLVTHLCKSISRNSKTRSQIVPCKSISIPLGFPPRSLGNESINEGPSALSHSSRYYVPCVYFCTRRTMEYKVPNSRTMAHLKESRWRRTQDIVYKYAPTTLVDKPLRSRPHRNLLVATCSQEYSKYRVLLGLEPELYLRLASTCCSSPTC